jgi:hypothetical protein
MPTACFITVPSACANAVAVANRFVGSAVHDRWDLARADLLEDLDVGLAVE